MISFVGPGMAGHPNRFREPSDPRPPDTRPLHVKEWEERQRARNKPPEQEEGIAPYSPSWGITKKFSIILPTRERPGLLKKLLDSIIQTTTNIDDIEVLLAIDADDPATWTFLNSFPYSFVTKFETQRTLNFSRDYYTYLAKQSRGQWIIALNDDGVFETMGWDTIAYDILKDKPRIIHAWSEDGIGDRRAKGHGEYCCFPMIGRRGFEALGFYFPSRIPTWGCDIWIKGLYNHIGSSVVLPITIRHFCFHNNTRDADHINRRVQNNQTNYDVRPNYREINCLLEAIKADKDANKKANV